MESEEEAALAGGSGLGWTPERWGLAPSPHCPACSLCCAAPRTVQKRRVMLFCSYHAAHRQRGPHSGRSCSPVSMDWNSTHRNDWHRETQNQGRMIGQGARAWLSPRVKWDHRWCSAHGGTRSARRQQACGCSVLLTSAPHSSPLRTMGQNALCHPGIGHSAAQLREALSTSPGCGRELDCAVRLSGSMWDSCRGGGGDCDYGCFELRGLDVNHVVRIQYLPWLQQLTVCLLCPWVNVYITWVNALGKCFPHLGNKEKCMKWLEVTSSVP